MAKRGIVMVGQSNHKTGYAYNRDDWSRGDPRMYQFKQDGTTVLATQAMDTPGSWADKPFTASLWYLVRDYLIPRNPGVDYCIVPVAAGGSTFPGGWHAPHPPDYATGGTNYLFAVAQMNAFLAAEVGNTIDVVILQNGEDDTNAASSNLGYYGGSYGLSDYAAYTRYVVEFVAGIQADVPGGNSGGVRTWPLLIGAMPPDIVYSPTFPILPNYPSGIGVSADGTAHNNSAAIPIWEACRDMPGVISNCGFVDPLNPVKISVHAGTATDGTGHVWLNSTEYWIHYDQPGLQEMGHRQFKQYMKLKGIGTVITVALGEATDTTAPTITTPSTANVDEGVVLAIALTASEAVTWTLTSGGSNFEISGTTLRWLGNGTKAWTGVVDAYVAQVRATDTASNFTDKTITVTVQKVVASTARSFSAEGISITGTTGAREWSAEGVSFVES
jgi:hypothetical protein